jgi:hypothetical protein
MPLKVVDRKVENRYEHDDWALLYHDLPFVIRQRLVMENVINGEILDPFKMAANIMKEMIYDWENVVDQNDKPIGFDKTLSVDSLPEEAIFKFVDEIVFPSLQGIIEFKKKLSGEDDKTEATVVEDSEAQEDDSKNS